MILWLIRWFRYYQPHPSIIKFPIIYFPNKLSSQHDCIHQFRFSYIAVTTPLHSQQLTTKVYTSLCRITTDAWLWPCSLSPSVCPMGLRLMEPRMCIFWQKSLFSLYALLLSFFLLVIAADTPRWIWKVEGQRNILKSYVQNWLWVRFWVVFLWIKCIHFLGNLLNKAYIISSIQK